MTDANSWDELEREVMSDPVARSAANENKARRQMAEAIDEARRERGLGIHELSELIMEPLSVTRRLLHLEQGGPVTLRAIYMAATKLELDVTFHVKRKEIEL